MKHSTKLLEAEILKSQSEVGGGFDKPVVRRDSEIHLLTTTREDDYFVRSATKWDQWVKLAVNIREHPGRWNAERIFQQFTEVVMKKVVMSLQLCRSAHVKPFPERLAGFDTKVEGRF